MIKSLVRNKYGIAHPTLVLSVIITIIVALGYLYLPRILTPNTSDTLPEGASNITDTPSDTTSDEPEDIGTYEGTPAGIDVKENWGTYVSPKYGYEITNPSNNWILYINDFANSEVNLRLKADSTPARHGFSIAVWVNPKYQTMKEMCDKGEITESTGILCSKKITTSTIKIGSITWEKIDTDNIGVVPNYEVTLSTFRDGRLFYVVAEGYSTEQITEILKSFRFTN